MNLQEIYGEDCYLQYNGGDYLHNQKFFNASLNAAKEIRKIFHPKTVLDVGCACGYLVKALRQHGIEAYGVDASEFAISKVDDSIQKYCTNMILPENKLPGAFPKKFDLVTSVEVLEHIPAEQTAESIKVLCSLSDTVIFSSSPDEENEQSHINVHPIAYWAECFGENDFYPDFTIGGDFISPQAVVFRKGEFNRQKFYPALDVIYRAKQDFLKLQVLCLERLDIISKQKKQLEILENKQTAELAVAAKTVKELEKRCSLLESKICMLKEESIASIKNIAAYDRHCAELQKKYEAECTKQKNAIKERDNLMAALDDIHKSKAYKLSSLLSSIRRLF
jgi:hypothetical protein